MCKEQSGLRVDGCCEWNQRWGCISLCTLANLDFFVRRSCVGMGASPVEGMLG